MEVDPVAAVAKGHASCSHDNRIQDVTMTSCNQYSPADGRSLVLPGFMLISMSGRISKTHVMGITSLFLLLRLTPAPELTLCHDQARNSH